jgi:hypothetical protein
MAKALRPTMALLLGFGVDLSHKGLPFPFTFFLVLVLWLLLLTGHCLSSTMATTSLGIQRLSQLYAILYPQSLQLSSLRRQVATSHCSQHQLPLLKYGPAPVSWQYSFPCTASGRLLFLFGSMLSSLASPLKCFSWATTWLFYCKCFSWATTRSFNCTRTPRLGGAIAKFHRATTKCRCDLYGLYLTFNLVAGLLLPFLQQHLLRFITGNRRFIQWPHQRFGYPASWMLLSCIMLSNHVVSGLLGTSFTSASMIPLLPPYPYRSSNYSTKSLRHLLRRDPSFFSRHQATTTRPVSFDEILSSIPSHRRFALPQQHATLFGGIMEYQGASDVLFSDMLRDPTSPPTDDPAIHMAKISPTSDRAFDILLDTGASVHISSFLGDFIGGQAGLLTTPPGEGRIKGLSGECTASGLGTLVWHIPDSTGNLQRIEGPGYYVPSANIRLLSPQTLFRSEQSGRLVMDSKSVRLELPGGGNLIVGAYKSNLPFATASDRLSRERNLQQGLHTGMPAQTAYTDEDHQGLQLESNTNLTGPERELLRLHCRAGHMGLHHVQDLIRQGKLTTKQSGSAKCTPPKCAACILGKMTRKNDGTTVLSKLPKPGIKAGDVQPGQNVSIDHFISKTSGRLPHTQGREPTHKQYSGGAIFVDHCSNFIDVQHQVLLSGSDTVRSKIKFEREAQKYGVTIQNYHADNGIFKSHEFVSALELREQRIDYSGVGAHHQNGAAEGSIRIVADRARTMMVHAAIHWPEAADPNLWPFAMKYAAQLYNITPNRSSLMSPSELFSGTKQHGCALDQARVWGCPAFVLEPMLQDGKKLPKWRRRSRVGQFLGFSSDHATTVGLIRNLATGYVSPQFHVVFDEQFQTVVGRGTLTEALWQSLDFVNYIPDETEDYLIPSQEPLQDNNTPPPTHDRAVPTNAPMGDPPGDLPSQGAVPPTIKLEQQVDEMPPAIVAIDDESDDDDDDDASIPPPPTARARIKSEVPAVEPRRGTRVREPNRWLSRGDMWVNKAALLNASRLRPTLSPSEAYVAGIDYKSKPISHEAKQHQFTELVNTDPDSGYLEDTEPLAFAAKLNDDDTPSFRDAMNGPDQAGFRTAMTMEWTQLKEKETWEVVDRQEPLQNGKNIVGIQWVFKRKRFPDGAIRKLKARLVVRGDQQVHGIDYFDTYAPVVSWSTVRTLLTMSCVLGLESKQIDYTLAFCQANLDEPVYVEMPQSFQVPGMVLKLKKSLYGLAVAPKLFFETLKEALESRGFVPSKIDPCMFVHGKMICLIYVDDCLFFSKSMKDIDGMIISLRETFDLNEEDNVAGFLGIKLNYQEDGSIQLLQDGLIGRITNALGLEETSTGADTPTLATPLGSDADGAPLGESFNYRSVVGMMLYLSSNSRPEISFAVSQCARFVQNPTVKHGEALKRIGRYLKTTQDKGLIIKPNQDLHLELYADADFAGLWGQEDPTDPVSVRSRTGCVITLGGAPILWKSKLQTETALSTMMAEYIALSNSMRELIPIKGIINEVTDAFQVKRDKRAFVTTCWEDNAGCLALANLKMPQTTPRSKFYPIKFHWFREQLVPHDIEIKKVDTLQQKADLWTKPFTKQKFEELRLLVCGW